jgi:DNA-binding PadR family transcriptional regulator
MSTTRLLVLGAVRIFQPAHGYLVRRELASWQVDAWANLNPGSIYNALRTLARDGLLAEAEATLPPGPGRPAPPGPGGRVAYRLTPDGETEFHRLVRDALWQLHDFEPAWLLSGQSFWWVLSRQEVLDALAARRAQLEARLNEAHYAGGDVRAQPLKPAHVVEHFLLHEHHLLAERDWVDAVRTRIEQGAYVFAGEGPLVDAAGRRVDGT